MVPTFSSSEARQVDWGYFCRKAVKTETLSSRGPWSYARRALASQRFSSAVVWPPTGYNRSDNMRARVISVSVGEVENDGVSDTGCNCGRTRLTRLVAVRTKGGL